MDRESRFRFARDEVIASGEVVEEARTIGRKYRLSLMQGYLIKKESEYYNGQHLVHKARIFNTESNP